MISDQNCTSRSSNTTLLQPFWNRQIQLVYFFDFFIILLIQWLVPWKVESETLLHLILYAKQKIVPFSVKMMKFRTEMMWFRTDVMWLNHPVESQSDYKDHQWFENGCNKSIKRRFLTVKVKYMYLLTIRRLTR